MWAGFAPSNLNRAGRGFTWAVSNPRTCVAQLGADAAGAQNSARQLPRAGGYGGIAFLLSTTFVRAFLTLRGHDRVDGRSSDGGRARYRRPRTSPAYWSWVGILCGLVRDFPPVHAIPGATALSRTLPISASRLAAVMLAVAVLPLVALGVLVHHVRVADRGASRRLHRLEQLYFHSRFPPRCASSLPSGGAAESRLTPCCFDPFRVLFRALVVADICPVPGASFPSGRPSRRDKHSCGFSTHAMRDPAEQSRLPRFGKHHRASALGRGG